ncbi:AAA family ATPase [uncultured Thiodictyon sp.]|jgi:MoxR-like ATPase|uniref:AAA family ATPase n=1 Tax=uncultured Thiodictyon sp. TaxID=1846217 RepID=UPI0025FBBB07|nr:AAA family ATPase [uncultured Thiodictyon sp.]
MIPDLPIDQPVPLPKCGTWPTSVHLFDQTSADAILAALAAERPLLVQGEPGAGKSQLARAAAVTLNRAFVSQVVHARSEAQDLQWEYDAVSRLGEAQVLGSLRSERSHRSNLTPQQRLAPRRFLCPGPLWWAFGWDSAREHNDDRRTVRRVPEPWHPEPHWQPRDGAVLLIDEIDKAEADLPNSLLETLGNGGFPVPWLDTPVCIPAGTAAPLVIITTNQERELPRAFLRRCLVLTLDLKEGDDLKALLVARGRQHFTVGSQQCVHDDILELVAAQLITDRNDAKDKGFPVPGQAEYLDLLRALDHARGGDPAAQKKLFHRIKNFALKKCQESAG